MGLGNGIGFSDDNLGEGTPALNRGRILDVTVNGNDLTASIGNPFKPFKTVKEAMNQALSGDLVRTFPGLYDEYNISPKSGVTLFMFPGARIQPTFNNGKAAIFTDLVLGVGVPDFKVRGYGEFVNVGIADSDTSSFVASFATSNYDIEAVRVSSFEAWNEIGAFIKIKNAIIDFHIIVYLGGTAVLENCTIRNAQFYLYYRPDFSKMVCYNCTIIKDSSNINYTTNYPTRAETLQCFIYDSLFANEGNDSVIEFHDTKFINLLGANNVLIGNQNNLNSYVGFYDCKFYNSDLSRKSVLYDDTGKADSNTLKFFYTNCISNVDVQTIDFNSNGSAMINEFGTPIMTVSPGFKLYY